MWWCCIRIATATILFQEGTAFLLRDLEDPARIDGVDETGSRLAAMLEQFVIASADFRHLLLRDWIVVKRNAPVRPPLENGQVFSRFGDLLDGLDATGAGADHGNALAVKVNSLFRPQPGVCRSALKIFDPFEPRHRRS